ncbi:MAG: malonyl-CoA synthase [Rhodocyclaceae bacterium]|nr:malonyl-CoA synthase [Rhodocyclaceae bacterium]
MNLYALFHTRFLTDLSKPILNTEDGRMTTAAEFDELTGRYAAFIQSLGVEPGDRVAVQVEKSVEAVMLYLACLRAGVVYLPLNTAYRESEIAYFLGDAAPKVFVHSPKDAEWVAPICESLRLANRFTMPPSRLDENAKADEKRADWDRNARNCPPINGFVHRNDDDLACILYTSGTTGRSKGAMLTHKNLSSNALTLHRAWGFTETDVLLHCLPLFHVHGLFVALNTILLNGGMMIFHTRFDGAAAIAALREATVFMGVPTYYTRMLAEPGFNAHCCQHMRLFVSGSAPLLAETFEEFRQRTGHTILERYGMTETGMITSNPLNAERRGGTVGFPLPEIDVRVALDDGGIAKSGEIGHIQLKGPNVLAGYWRMPEKTAEEFTPDGYFKTGDMGVFSNDGYLSIVGRSKDLVISGGYNVYPKEIELLLDTLDGVAESAVIGLPHPDFGEAVAAVVAKKADAALEEAAVISTLKKQLANFKVPKRVFVVAELPRNAMGKVQKNVLRQQYGDTFAPKVSALNATAQKD